MPQHSLTRRRLATIAASGLAVGLAGCADDDVEEPEDPDGAGNGGVGNGEADDPVEEDDEEV